MAALAFFPLLLAVASAVADPASVDAAAPQATVLEITDGDTIDVEVRGREEAVPLIGIDTPEVYFGEECGGAAAFGGA